MEVPEEKEPSNRPRWRRVLVRLTIFVGVSLLTFLAAELVHRGWLRAHGEPDDGVELLRRLRQQTQPMAAFTPSDGGPDVEQHADYTLTPYYGAERRFDEGGVLAYFDEERSADDYVVLVVGGSVATV